MHPDEVAGYQAAIHYCWAKQVQRRASTVPGMAEEHPPPEGSTPEFAAGWRVGIQAGAR